LALPQGEARLCVCLCACMCVRAGGVHTNNRYVRIWKISCVSLSLSLFLYIYICIDISLSLYIYTQIYIYIYDDQIYRNKTKLPPQHASTPHPSMNTQNRIHFALNCGAKSCPPIKEFSAEAVDEELRISGIRMSHVADMNESCHTCE